MLRYPHPGTRVELRYRPSVRRATPMHGLCGVVLCRADGPGPRNHLIDVDGIGPVVVPGGQLRKARG